MKKIMFCIAICATLNATAQQSLEKLWESDTTLAIPESVLPVAGKNLLYVSLIDGEPWGADGRGGIAVLDKKGAIINAAWITGLNAPKGMGIHGGKLYVTDMGDVVVIDISKEKIERKIPVAGAEGLNDISIAKNGTVYVSDSKTGKVHSISKGTVALVADSLKGLNGLLADGKDLYICTANVVYKKSGNKPIQAFATMPMGGDGIEPVGNGDLLTSTWSGVIYYITKEGAVTSILDTREQKINTADIGYDAKERIVYVPTFFAKSVAAYKLK